MDGPARHHSRIKFDFSECVFVAHDIVLKDGEQRLGLLGAQINPLEILHLNLGFALLLERAKDEEKIPNIYADLNTVGIGLPVVRRVHHFDIWLRWNRHKSCSVAQIKP